MTTQIIASLIAQIADEPTYCGQFIAETDEYALTVWVDGGFDLFKIEKIEKRLSATKWKEVKDLPSELDEELLCELVLKFISKKREEIIEEEENRLSSIRKALELENHYNNLRTFI